MKNAIRLVAVVAIGAFTVVGLPTVSSADGSTTRCTDTLTPGTYGHVVVPRGAACVSPGNVTIRHGVVVRHGGSFVLGDEGTPNATSTIRGGVRAKGPANLQIHFTDLRGGIRSEGGAGPFCGEECLNFTTIEDSWIRGGVSITRYDGFWMGFIRNHVWGTVILRRNVLVDTDGNEYVTNVIHGSLKCADNVPAPQVGDSEGSPNVVTGKKHGQCRAV